jgi:branched-chain amino acid transport system substrate-binding protein
VRTSFAALVAVVLSLSVGPRATAAGPYEITAILPLTGFGAFLGTREAQALGVLEKLVNREGGLRGEPIKFVVLDDQSSPQLSVQLTNAAVAKHVPVILGSSVAPMCLAMAPLVEKAGPVDYCFSPVVHPTPGGYVFSSSAGSDDIAKALVRFFRERGAARLAVITSTDASGQDFDREFDAALRLAENRGVQVVAREHFNPNDVSVSAQMARIKAADPQALITFTTGTPLGTVLRSFHDSGLEIPLSASAGNMIYEQMAQYKSFAPKELYFAATRGIAPDPTLRSGPIKEAQTVYFDAFKAAGLVPDFASSLAWDPTLIVVDALRRLGTDASAQALHRYIEGLHGWTGIDGVYDFRDNPQRGIGENAMIVYRWDPSANRFLVASKPGGRVR